MLSYLPLKLICTILPIDVISSCKYHQVSCQLIFIVSVFHLKRWTSVGQHARTCLHCFWHFLDSVKSIFKGKMRIGQQLLQWGPWTTATTTTTNKRMTTEGKHLHHLECQNSTRIAEVASACFFDTSFKLQQASMNIWICIKKYQCHIHEGTHS